MASSSFLRSDRGQPPGTRVGILVVAVLGLAVLAGCTSSSESASATVTAAATIAAAEGDSAASAPDKSGGGGAAAPSAAAEVPAGAPATAPDPAVPDLAVPDPALANRQVIRTASMTFTERVAPVLDPATGEPDEDADAAARSAAVQAAAGRIATIGAGVGGYRGAVEAGGDSVVITMRVPVDSYEAVMKQLGALGTPESLVEKTTDVTSQVVDLESRITTMRAGVDRVRTLLAEADKVAEIIAIESELTAREADLESLLSQQAALADQVSLSTVTVTVHAVTEFEPAAAVAPVDRSGFSAGLASGWAAAKDFVMWVGAVLGALLPFLPLIAGVGVVVWWIRRRGHRQPRPPEPAPDQH